MATPSVQQSSPASPSAHQLIVAGQIQGSATIVTLFKEVSALVRHRGPLRQVLDVTAQLVFVVNDIKDNRDGCELLIERILLFLKNFINECLQLNLPTQHGTSIGARLYALVQYVFVPGFFDLQFPSRVLFPQEHQVHQG
jgi:hypothetical protein